MATGRLSRLRGTSPLLRILTFVAAAITTILLGAAIPVAHMNGDQYDGEAFLLEITLPFVSIAQL